MGRVTGFMALSPPPIKPYQAKWFDAKPLFELRTEPFDIKLSSWRHAPPNRFGDWGLGVRDWGSVSFTRTGRCQYLTPKTQNLTPNTQ